jgi:hypothetical protein
MKTINTVLAVAVTALVSQGLYAQTTIVQNGKVIEPIVGNGEVVKQERVIGAFDKLNVQVGMRVRIEEGKAETATLEGESNLLGHVITDVKDGELTVKLAQNQGYNHSKPITVTIHTGKLQQILVSTGCSVESDLPIKSNNFTATVETGSRLTASVTTKNLKLIVAQGSQASLEGKATEADIRLSSAGKLQADKLTIARANVRLDGASQADIHVTESLSAAADGISTVNYTGNPTVKSMEATGLSKIRKQG